MTMMYRYADVPATYTEGFSAEPDHAVMAPIIGIEAEGGDGEEDDQLTELRRIAQMESAAPGIARAWLDVRAAREARADTYRALRLVSVLTLCMLTIGIGQWALVQGASTEALYLTGAGLAGLVASFLKGS